MSSYSQKNAAMAAGGAILRRIKTDLQQYVQVGQSFAQIESYAQQLMAAAGVKPNFSTVPGYHWATCIMKNDELCHGIPSNDKTVVSGDLITIDCGILYDGYHLDTTISFGVGDIAAELEYFLSVGKKSLTQAIHIVKAGVSVYDISRVMQKVVERAGFNAVYQLTGHGIGTELHMDPAIPCVAQRSDKQVVLNAGDTVAIEIMYTAGEPEVYEDKDGWTYKTVDGSMAGMFEETVLVTEHGFQILT